MYLDQIAHYWDRRAHGYAKTIQEQLSGQERDFFQRLLRNQAPAGKSLRCLDIGCGPGFFSILLAQAGHQVTAMDYSQGMLEHAKQHFHEAGVAVATLQVMLRACLLQMTVLITLSRAIWSGIWNNQNRLTGNGSVSCDLAAGF